MNNSWICVDASALLRPILGPNPQQWQEMWENWEKQGLRIAAPSLLFFEVSNALYQYQRGGYLSAEAVQVSLQAALVFPIQLITDPDLHPAALELAADLTLPAAYDAHYMALAERLDAPLWTADKRLADKVKAEFPRVHYLA